MGKRMRRESLVIRNALVPPDIDTWDEPQHLSSVIERNLWL